MSLPSLAWRQVRRSPATACYLAVVWVVGLATGSITQGPPRWLSGRVGAPALARARLLVDSAERRPVGIWPRRLSGHDRARRADPRPGRAPTGRSSYLRHDAGQPGDRPTACRRADRAGRADSRALAALDGRRDGGRRPPRLARRRLRVELHAYPAVAPAAAAADNHRGDDRRDVPRAPGAGRAGMRRGRWLCQRDADVRPGVALGGSAQIQPRGPGAGRPVGGGAGDRRRAGRARRQCGRADVTLLPVRRPGADAGQSGRSSAGIRA